MIALISSEECFHGEIELIKQILKLSIEFFFHVRKPKMTEEEFAHWLSQFSVAECRLMVSHQWYDLSLAKRLRGIHATEKSRVQGMALPFLSTSFHSEIDMIKEANKYSYFFCSPVFQSISKPNYTQNCDWDLSNSTTEIKAKAFALGGIETKNIKETKELGFHNFAFLGAVWQAKDPLMAFNQIYTACTTDQFV